MADSQRRREGVQRVQAGLIGLAGVVLMVGLANIVIERANRNDPSVAEAVRQGASRGVGIGNLAAPSEPLAELGVTPAADGSGARVVPDLQPDPNLKKPMDRDPQR